MNKREKWVFWKWSVDEPYYRSAPRQRQGSKVIDSESDKSVYDSQQNAINQSLEFETNAISNSNMREEIDDKMAGRELVLQRGANPFMQQTSYVNDIVVRDMFLKPINTTQGRNKQTDSDESSAVLSSF
jgi:hypothetical protein